MGHNHSPAPQPHRAAAPAASRMIFEESSRSVTYLRHRRELLTLAVQALEGIRELDAREGDRLADLTAQHEVREFTEQPAAG